MRSAYIHYCRVSGRHSHYTLIIMKMRSIVSQMVAGNDNARSEEEGMRSKRNEARIYIYVDT